MDVSAFRQIGAHAAVDFSVTVHPSEARDDAPPGFLARLNGRLPAILLTLCLQIGLLLLLLHSLGHGMSPSAPLVRETYLRLPRLIEPRVAPSTIDARGNPRPTAPVFVPPVWQAPPAVPPVTGTAPDIRGLGQALNNCTPENYARLLPEERSRCPHPGSGVAIQQAPPLLGERSHVRNEAYWREQWAEAHWVPGPCPTGEPVLPCLVRQWREEQQRMKEARQRLATAKAATLATPRPTLPNPRSGGR